MNSSRLWDFTRLSMDFMVTPKSIKKCGWCEKNYFSIHWWTLSQWFRKYFSSESNERYFDQIIDLNNFMNNVCIFGLIHCHHHWLPLLKQPLQVSHLTV